MRSCPLVGDAGGHWPKKGDRWILVKNFHGVKSGKGRSQKCRLAGGSCDLEYELVCILRESKYYQRYSYELQSII